MQLLRAGRGRRCCAARRHGRSACCNSIAHASDGSPLLGCGRGPSLVWLIALLPRSPPPPPSSCAGWRPTGCCVAAAAGEGDGGAVAFRSRRRAEQGGERRGGRSGPPRVLFGGAARRAPPRVRAPRRPHRLPARQRGEPGGAPRVAFALAARPHTGRLHRGGRWLARLAAHAVPPLDAPEFVDGHKRTVRPRRRGPPHGGVVDAAHSGAAERRRALPAGVGRGRQPAIHARTAVLPLRHRARALRRRGRDASAPPRRRRRRRQRLPQPSGPPGLRLRLRRDLQRARQGAAAAEGRRTDAVAPEELRRLE